MGDDRFFEEIISETILDSGMIKFIRCLRRLPRLSLEDFQAHWRDCHARFSADIDPLRRCVQYHTLANDPVREALAQAGIGGVAPYDGVEISWWDDLATLRETLARHPSARAAQADEALFVDKSRSVSCLTREEVIVEPVGAVPLVLIECLRRRFDINWENFSVAWLRHADIGRRANELGLLKGYIQNHTHLSESGEFLSADSAESPWDGITTAYFDSVAAFIELAASPLASKESFADEKTFIDHSQAVSMLSQRRVIKDLVR